MNEAYLIACQEELRKAIREIELAQSALQVSLYGETAESISDVLYKQRSEIQGCIDRIDNILKEKRG
jgi:hypothetical protein